MATTRRECLASLTGLALGTALGGCGTVATQAGGVSTLSAKAATPGSSPLAQTAVYVPGYEPEKAGLSRFGLTGLKRATGLTKGPLRLLSRIGMDGSIRQALLPAHAHDVEIAPDRSVGVLCGFEARGQVAFDPETLEMVALAPAFAEGWRGGGHAVYIDGGRSVVLSERAPREAVQDGRLSRQYGRVTIRDAATLTTRDSYSTYGIDPHDIRLIENGRYLVAANYGSLPKAGETELAVPRDVAEACVTIIDMRSGKLVEKIVTDRHQTEVRHLAAGRLDRIFAIQAKLGGPDFAHLDEAEDITSEPGIIYRPAATLKLAKGRSPRDLATPAATAQMRHGLSIAYDAMADEVIATYPSSHRVMVFDGGSGALIRNTDMRSLGLRYPCGVTLLPDGRHYAITGYRENLFVFERKSHRLNREMCLYPTFYGHSHITAA